MNCQKIFSSVTLSSAAFLLLVTPAFAAAPDGLGPWADSVLSSTQGLMKNGLTVPAIRSNPASALGVAENNTTDGNFFSLGFGGNIALGFDNGISSGVIIVEATNPGYPNETAKVEVSENGTTWVNAGTVTADGSVNKPAGITCAKYVRITDTSNPDNFSDATADGYDVDGVQAQGDPCTPPTTGGGNGCCCGNLNVKQKSNTNVGVSINAGSNSGGNSSSFNNQGNNNITTGPSTTNTNVTVTGGNNTVTTGGGNCTPCPGTGGNLSIIGNGPGSKNTINVNSNDKKKKF